MLDGRDTERKSKVTDEGHMFYSCGKEDKHEHGVGFVVHKNTTSSLSSVVGYRPVSKRICTIRLRAPPFNITIVQVHALISDYDDEQVESFTTNYSE